jgi:hypothetical protein
MIVFLAGNFFKILIRKVLIRKTIPSKYQVILIKPAMVALPVKLSTQDIKFKGLNSTLKAAVSLINERLHVSYSKSF